MTTAICPFANNCEIYSRFSVKENDRRKNIIKLEERNLKYTCNALESYYEEFPDVLGEVGCSHIILLNDLGTILKNQGNQTIN